MFDYSIMENIKQIIQSGAASSMTEKEVIEMDIKKWKSSEERREMLTGKKYYQGYHDILNRKRTVIGRDGVLTEVTNLPNNKDIDNQYQKMVNQKKNYLLGKPLTFDTDNEAYEEALKSIFNMKFNRQLKGLGKDALNGGIAWLHPYYNENGELKFKKFEAHEILPYWKDTEHTELDIAVRLYEDKVYEGRQEKTVEKVEIYGKNGVDRFVLVKGSLVPDVENPSSPYIMIGEDGYNWSRIPLIPFKYNDSEIPLIRKVKSLQDGINIILSDFQNNMMEDARSTILVIHNYGGNDMGEFRHNLATFGAINVISDEGRKGGVDTLQVEVNAENYKEILRLLKKALIENAGGFDAKDDRLGNNPNQMNIQSMYSDIDLDANDMETEFQASFEELLFFVNAHLANTGVGDFEGEQVKIVFNRDMLMNESEIMKTLNESGIRHSQETLLAQSPYVDDVGRELERLEEEEKKSIEQYAGAFQPIEPGGEVDEE